MRSAFGVIFSQERERPVSSDERLLTDLGPPGERRERETRIRRGKGNLLMGCDQIACIIMINDPF